MDRASLLGQVLVQAPPSIPYLIGEALDDFVDGRSVIESDSEHFDLAEFAEDGLCTVRYRNLLHQQINTRWEGPTTGFDAKPRMSGRNTTFKNWSRRPTDSRSRTSRSCSCRRSCAGWKIVRVARWPASCGNRRRRCDCRCGPRATARRRVASYRRFLCSSTDYRRRLIVTLPPLRTCTFSS